MELRAGWAIVVTAALAFAGCAATDEYASATAGAPSPCPPREAGSSAAAPAPLVRFKLRDGSTANLYATRPRTCGPEHL